MLKKDLIRDISNFIFVSDAPEKSDVIFLPGSSYSEIPEAGAKLWKSGFAEVIIPSGKFSLKAPGFMAVKTGAEIYNGNYRTECDFYTDVLTQNGVPSSAVIGENQATFTMENAIFTKDVCRASGINVRRAIVCCKAYHARRCQIYYGAEFPCADILIYPVVCKGIAKDNWYETEEGISTVLSELEKCGGQCSDCIGDLLKNT